MLIFSVLSVRDRDAVRIWIRYDGILEIPLTTGSAVETHGAVRNACPVCDRRRSGARLEGAEPGGAADAYGRGHSCPQIR